jgi:uncharacterized membrane protein YoaK (UPF0700 family)
MTRVESSMLVLLAAIAGWIDALSFTALGKVFTSFQSGNLIFLGLGVDEGDAQLFVGAGVSLLAFLAVAGLLSRDHEFQSIGSTRRRTLYSHPNLRGGDGSSWPA